MERQHQKITVQIDSEQKRYNYAFFIFTNTSSTNGFYIASNYLIKQDKPETPVEKVPEVKSSEAPSKPKRKNRKKKDFDQLSEESESLDQELDESMKWGKDTEQFYLENLSPSDTQKYKVDIYFIDLMDKQSKAKGFYTFKKIQKEKNTHCRSVVCGGDGTIMWVVDELLLNGIDLNDQALAAIAVGTGNDFCRAMGWGTSLSDSVEGDKFNLNVLKKMATKWIKSQIQNLDIWDIEVQTHEDGCFQQIKKGKNGMETITLKENNQKLQKLKHHMVNYFSVGLDAQIGYDFDKHRTQSRCINKFFYCWEGFKKLFTKKLRIDRILDSFKLMRGQNQNQNKQKLSEKTLNFEIDLIDDEAQDQHHCIFRSSEYKQSLQDKLNSLQDCEDQKSISTEATSFMNDNFLTGDPINLVCQNITSYCAGAEYIWANCKSPGLKNHKDEAISEHDKDFDIQHHGDGQLEFITFRNIVEFIMERYVSGFGSRVTQGNGPFLINFKKGDENNNPITTYFQIDGEYFQVISPKFIKITHSQDVPQGKVKVMVGEQRAKEIELKQHLQKNIQKRK